MNLARYLPCRGPRLGAVAAAISLPFGWLGKILVRQQKGGFPLAAHLQRLHAVPRLANHVHLFRGQDKRRHLPDAPRIVGHDHGWIFHGGSSPWMLAAAGRTPVGRCAAGTDEETATDRRPCKNHSRAWGICLPQKRGMPPACWHVPSAQRGFRLPARQANSSRPTG